MNSFGHEKMFLITGVPYKRKVNWFLAKNWGMKIDAL